MDIAQALNAPQPLPLAGRVYPVRQLKLREWAALQAWLKAAFPSPVTLALQASAEARALGVPVPAESERALFDAAAAQARQWPPAVASRAWFDALDASEGGWAKVVAEVLGAGGTPTTDAEAEAVVENATVGELIDLTRAACYGDPPLPKGPAADTGGAATATSPTTSPGSTSGG